jgi:hypothetical protein
MSVYASSIKPLYRPNFRPSLIVKSSDDVHTPSSNTTGLTLRLNHLSLASFGKDDKRNVWVYVPNCSGLEPAVLVH